MAVRLLAPVLKGEGPGHPFRGNQHTGGIGGGGIDVDKLLADNPQHPGESIFDYQSRVLSNVDPKTKSDILFRLRERYAPVPYIADGAQRWRQIHGLPEPKADIAEVPVPLDKGNEVAQAFEQTPDQSANPVVQRAFDDFKAQNDAMFTYMTTPTDKGGMGVKVDFVDRKDPYSSATAQADDLRYNRHIFIEKGLGGHHEATMSRDEYDRFRAVHDTFGHAGVGRGFDRHGEYEAWLEHTTMYTGLGRAAMSSEYHGVNTALWGGAPGTPGTGKAVLLPFHLIRDPFDSQGNLVRKSAKLADELIDKLRLTTAWVVYADCGPMHCDRGRVLKGDAPGHDFHGNQYTGGIGGGGAGHIGHPFTQHDFETPHSRGKQGKPIVTDNVTVAAAALAEGKYVELRQPREVSTLLDRLAEIAKDAEAKGADAPNYDLCKVSISGTNLFCAGNLGIERVKMPQLKGTPEPGSLADSFPKSSKGEADVSASFREELKNSGVKISQETEKASYLRSTQNQLVGSKVGSMVRAMAAGKIADEPIFVSRDNYILDGHHRWAAKVGTDLADNKLGDVTMPITRVDLPITDLLGRANEFTSRVGIRTKAAVSKGFVMMSHLLPVWKAGDLPGHPFHGNQYTGGIGGGQGGASIKPITSSEARGNSRAVTSEEFSSLATKGQAQLKSLADKSSPPTGLDKNFDNLTALAFKAAQESWGGVTIDAHSGQPVESNADAYAITVKDPGQSSVTIPESATQPQFAKAMKSARTQFTDQLSRADHHLGVFHDDHQHTIEFDPVLIVKTPGEVESIGAATHAIGGAYHFASGDGFFPPHVGEVAKMGTIGLVRKAAPMTTYAQFRHQAEHPDCPECATNQTTAPVPEPGATEAIPEPEPTTAEPNAEPGFQQPLNDPPR